MTPAARKALMEARDAVKRAENPVDCSVAAIGRALLTAELRCYALVRDYADELLADGSEPRWISTEEAIPPFGEWVIGVSRILGQIGPYYFIENMDDDDIRGLITMWFPVRYPPLTKDQFLCLGNESRGLILRQQAENALRDGTYAPPEAE